MTCTHMTNLIISRHLVPSVYIVYVRPYIYIFTYIYTGLLIWETLWITNHPWTSIKAILRQLLNWISNLVHWVWFMNPSNRAGSFQAQHMHNSSFTQKEKKKEDICGCITTKHNINVHAVPAPCSSYHQHLWHWLLEFPSTCPPTPFGSSIDHVQIL